MNESTAEFSDRISLNLSRVKETLNKIPAAIERLYDLAHECATINEMQEFQEDQIKKLEARIKELDQKLKRLSDYAHDITVTMEVINDDNKSEQRAVSVMTIPLYIWNTVMGEEKP